jgi:hypothetical protein
MCVFRVILGVHFGSAQFVGIVHRLSLYGKQEQTATSKTSTRQQGAQENGVFSTLSPKKLAL